MSTKKLNVSWPAKFALMDHFNPSDAEACEVFEVSQAELDTARNLRAVGTLASDHHFDVSKYANVFTTASTNNTSSQTVHSITKGDTMSKTTATVHTKPETATKKVKEPQKRGRKGDKIAIALTSIPTTPVPVDTFISQYGVSLAVLRQSKRFIQKLDPAVQAEIGHVNVRQDKTTKQLMIWKEVNSN